MSSKREKMNKALFLITVFLGILVIVVLPLLRILAHFTGKNLVSSEDHTLALILFLFLVYFLREEGRSKKI
jgi:hypothetical protein